MRILGLRFLNLNSLVGEWAIDFTAPAYECSGIFAISGPTGAGKSTILDALCLGLYGRTPRLGKLTKTTNEIMSRHQGVCFAEVEFRTNKGHFRSHWSQHRARKKASGELQHPHHELVDVTTGTVLESKLKAVEGRIEETTGMDFERFTRSVLLAQGGFAAFLLAKPDERAPLLEQITGTDIYSRISIATHERKVAEFQKLEGLRETLGGLTLLQPEEVARLHQEVAVIGQELERLTAEAKMVGEALAWRQRLERLARELTDLERQWTEFEARKKEADPQLARLALAQKALALDGEWAQTQASRQTLARDREQLAAVLGRLPQLQRESAAGDQVVVEANQALDAARAQHEREAVLLKEVRALDSRLVEAQTQRKAAQEEVDRGLALTNTLRSQLFRTTEQAEKTAERLGPAEGFLAEHAVDQTLTQHLAGIVEQCKQWTKLHQQHLRKKQERTGAGQALARARQLLAAREKERAEATAGRLTAEQILSQRRSQQAELLHGRTAADWREEGERWAQRGRLLADLQGQLKEQSGLREKLGQIEGRKKILSDQQAALTREQQRLAEESERRTNRVREAEVQLRLRQRVRDLEEERARLVEGHPCPLCGATDHPYAVGTLPPLDEAERALAEAQAAQQQALQQLGTLQQDLARTGKDLELATLNWNEVHQRLLQLVTASSDRQRELALASGTERSSEAHVEAAARESEAHLVRCRDLSRQIDEGEIQLRAAETAWAAAKEAEARLDRAVSEATHGLQRAEADQHRLTEEETTLASELARQRQEVLNAVSPYALSLTAPEETERVLEILTERQRAYQEKVVSRDALLKQRDSLAAQAEALRARLEQAEVGHAAQRQRWADVQARVEAFSAERQRLYGAKDPEQQEQSLLATIRERERLVNQARTVQAQGHTALAKLEQERHGLVAAVTQRETELTVAEPRLQALLTQAGFTDEDAYRAARLSEAAREELGQLAETLRQAETQLRTRRHDREAELQAERAKQMTDQSPEDLGQELEVLRQRQEEHQQARGALILQLEQHAQQQARQQAQLQALAAQEQEYRRWQDLHQLIGSADGKRFRNFAQGLTFEIMVSHANRQLERMTDRYLLVRDSEQPLELNVVDNYLAGEVRSTKNLSGGESFLVSLALALGLSHMASRNVQVDSLFLDEGFGTLDEEALETALGSLSSLHQDGKLIGVISHVWALKERISTQIEVVAGAGGRSRLVGPGVMDAGRA